MVAKFDPFFAWKQVYKVAQNGCCGIGNLVDNLNPCDQDTSILKPQNMFNTMGTGKKTKFEDYTWNKLPNKARSAAETLGLTQETWDAKEWSSMEDYYWEDLNATQKEAAEILGWDESAWDSKYENKAWSDLPSHVQDAASSVGFTQQTWDGDYEWPVVGNKYWNDMSEQEQRALHTLGYYKYNWE